ncbi:methyl-accepting chemotaxis protein [Sporolactobacillus putidus]|uniref:Methyl-accepting chemotaxis protein n=1 Tax=Sporolactobacillus putidus TaxID=492735 RepID=A0A917S511_9BACL|nr:methyl-accepting chemotaxis protein [Sporolactobacillus putidus]GGL57525.1 hypothetical protein GCM10007968_21910 [Sporolactobacillus putidus]
MFTWYKKAKVSNKLLASYIFLAFISVLISYLAAYQVSSDVARESVLSGGVLLFLIIGLIISRRVSKPFLELKNLIGQIEHMTNEHETGDIDVMIPEDQFDGEYQIIVKKINRMVNDLVSMNKKAMDVVAQFGKGNFEAPLENFPGKKAFINESIETLRTDLKKVHAEINRLIKAAHEGRLSERADSSEFSGDWATLIDGLNSLIDAILAPIQEVSAVLNELDKGNLQMRVEGNYKGDHERIKIALNDTVTTLENNIKEVSEVLTEMSEGNMDVAITTEYRGDFSALKKSLNHIIQSFNSLLHNINNASNQVAAGSKQVSDSAQELASGATEQASSIEQLTASMEEISSQTDNNAKHAGKADSLVNVAKKEAVQGNDRMAEMLKSMDDINESSSNISKIIKVIDEIAFQTNILALNAAVEAARAGQHGKGFAVVAEEVRNLAARSAGAAKETTALIEGSIKKVEKGTKIAKDTAGALNKIVDAVTEVATSVNNIAVASKEQASGISQINQGIMQVSQVVQANSATSEESAAASEELTSQAELLREMVAKFKLKDASGQTFSESEKISPKVLKMIEKLGKQENERELVQPEKQVPVAAAINDHDFGKY